jgi:hypothetical protein
MMEERWHTNSTGKMKPGKMKLRLPMPAENGGERLKTAKKKKKRMSNDRITV